MSIIFLFLMAICIALLLVSKCLFTVYVISPFLLLIFIGMSDYDDSTHHKPIKLTFNGYLYSVWDVFKRSFMWVILYFAITYSCYYFWSYIESFLVNVAVFIVLAYIGVNLLVLMGKHDS